MQVDDDVENIIPDADSTTRPISVEEVDESWTKWFTPVEDRAEDANWFAPIQIQVSQRSND